MKFTFTKFLLSIFLLTAALYTVDAQTSSIVSGRVLDTKNMPIKGVNIQIVYIPWNKVITAVSNQKGIFSIANLAPGGPYLVKFTCEGYRDYTREVSSLELGNSNDLSLHMQQEAREDGSKSVVEVRPAQNDASLLKSATL